MLHQAGEGQGRQAHEQAGIKGQRVHPIVPQGQLIEDGIQGIGEPGAQSPQDHPGGHRLLPQGEQPRDQDAARKGHHQRPQFLQGDLLVEAQGGQQNDKGRRGIQQHRRHRHGAGLDGVKIAHAGQHQGAHAAAEEIVPVPGIDLQGLRLFDGQIKSIQQGRQAAPQGHPRVRGQSRPGEQPQKHAHAAPKGGGHDDAETGVSLFLLHGSCLFPSVGLYWVLRPRYLAVLICV